MTSKTKKDWYFTHYESRQPEPVNHPSPKRIFVTQVLASASITMGVWYLIWRWTDSLNWGAPGFSILLVTAETLAFIGTVLFTINLWYVKDTQKRKAPSRLSEISLGSITDRNIVVDVFYPTYNEDVELVRLSILDAKNMRIPNGIDVQIHVLDDGNREEMKDIAIEEGVNYFARIDNVGFKAGNIRNGMEKTDGDLMVIFDADTRPFPAFLEQTLGYFRDKDVAWVQTPQWFFDCQEGTPLPKWLEKNIHLGKFGKIVGHGLEKVFGPTHVGQDTLGNDPSMFYDIILRRRNWCNASFCCGAGSVHRREAIMNQALKRYVSSALEKSEDLAQHVSGDELHIVFKEQLNLEIARRSEVMPYIFHVSEDIYTGIHLHADTDKKWKSVFHPETLSKMLSPQDLVSWSLQRFKYAGGTLDIFAHDSPLAMKGLSIMQKIMYGATFFSYLSPLWIVPFLFAPIIFFFSGIAPVSAYGGEFYAHLIPFLFLNRLALMSATWGVSTVRGEQYYIAFFWQNIVAMWEVLCRQPIKFQVTPKERQSGIQLDLVWPQFIIISLSVAGALYMGWNIYIGSENHIAAYVVNVFWALNNCLALSIIVRASMLREPEEVQV